MYYVYNCIIYLLVCIQIFMLAKLVLKMFSQSLFRLFLRKLRSSTVYKKLPFGIIFHS